jgi:1-acyl-sn-glycerol-3-phosphate acyltransferase
LKIFTEMTQNQTDSGPRQIPLAPAWIRRCLYAMGQTLSYLAGRFLWRLTVEGSERVPHQGAVIIACNHLSLADPPLVGASISRPVHFIAKQQLFEIPLFGWLIRQVNAFPVRREERDVSAFKTAQRILESGQIVVLFPEGTRSRTGKIGRAKPGVGMLASKTKAVVIPTCLDNTQHMKKFKKIRIRFGWPMRFDGQLDYQQFSDAILNEVRKMQEEMHRVA